MVAVRYTGISNPVQAFRELRALREAVRRMQGTVRPFGPDFLILQAVTKALEQAGFLLVAAGLTWCVSDPERAAAQGYAIEDVQKMFMKLA